MTTNPMNNLNNPNKSPDFLAGPPKRGIGVRRLNRRPLIIVLVIVASIVGAIGYTYQAKVDNPSQNTASSEEAQKAEPANAAAVFSKDPAAGVIPSDVPTDKNMPVLSTEPTSNTPPSSVNPPSNPQQLLLEQQLQQLAQFELSRLNTQQAAVESQTTVFSGKNQQPPNPVSNTANLYPQNYPPGIDGSEREMYSPQNSQKNKRDFLLTASISALGATSDYLSNTKNAPLSPYEIKAGTVIPSVMLNGISSDLPGPLIAQVSENVYDTATGNHLLIPQGAKLVGTYDDGVTYGQKRILVVWNRIIFPDASSLDLGSMPGTDQAGYAGYQDQVNNHLGSTFRTALLLSVITAGIELSQPRPRNGTYGYDSQQIIAGALGQQMGQLGMSTLSRGLNVPPTLTVRPGFHFNVMLTKDIVIPPWERQAS